MTNTLGGGIRPPSLLSPIQRWGKYPEEDWQIDFTQMPPPHENKYFVIDTFMDWIEAYPTEQKRPRRLPTSY